MSQNLCMFCGREILAEQLTREHFVPKGLWERGQHPNATQTLPAHRECNHAYAADNEYFRDVMLFEDGVDRHPKAKDVQRGAIKRKMEKRPGSISKNLKNLGIRRVHTPAGIDLGKRPVFEVDWPRIERVLRNVLKGVFQVSQKFPLPQHFLVTVGHVGLIDSEWLKGIESFMCPWQSFGDTVFCCRYVRSRKEPIQKFTCLMQFYEHRLFLGEAIDPRILGEDGEMFVPSAPNSMVLVPRWTAER